MALSRLAQKVDQKGRKGKRELKLRMYYDANPTKKRHWGYQLFHRKLDPVSKQPIANPNDFAWMQMNPEDNLENINRAYIEQLRAAGGATLKRFLKGEWSDDNPNALFDEGKIETYRNLGGEVPPLVRVGVAVDPSGADDDDADEHDEIGIVVGGLGIDGNGYLLEDLTIGGGPGTWSKIVADAYARHSADFVVGETNYGGAMVRQVIQTQDPRIPFRKVTATRGKVVRAEPISALHEQGKIRHVGFFPELEEELAGFSTTGYTGIGSPNRADAYVWLWYALFPGLVQKKAVEERPSHAVTQPYQGAFDAGGWMT
jgi:phage terminase large subunit-like protein